MPYTIEVETTVLPGHRIEICTPELPEGHLATVRITLNEERVTKRPFHETLGSYPGRGLFTSAEEVDAYLRSERDSWDK